MKTPTQFPTFSVSRRRFPSTFLAGLGSALLLAITPTDGQAGSSTWNLSPISTDWNTAANWNPATVPNGPNDIASFGFSNQPAAVLSANTSVSSLIYNADASSYNTTVPTGITLTVNDGITNNSAVAQGFVIDHGSLVFNFESGGSAGELTNYFLNGSGSTLTFSSGLASPNETYTIEGGGQILFNNSSAARGGTIFTLEGNGDGVPGLLQFSGDGESCCCIINLNGTGAGANCVFLGEVESSFSTFNVNGADSAAHGPGVLIFAENSNGLSANLIANAGSNGGAGGKIIIRDSASCPLSPLEVYGNASYDVSGATLGGGVVSLKGDGLIFLGARQLVYTGDVPSVFSGIIQDGGESGGSGGSLLMTGGRGPLTLNGANTYSGGTTVNVFSLTRRRGTLIVRNRTGSGTGSGPVTVVQGLLGGSGTIKGAVSLTGLSQIQPGILAPAAGGRIASTLTIKNLLTFGSSGGLFNPLIQSTANKTRIDRVNARGVTIGSGAQFALLADQLQSTLEVGASFTLISNTSANPINGTFGNLPDGAIVTVNGNNFQASYEGGDGNDLTLTVIS